MLESVTIFVLVFWHDGSSLQQETERRIVRFGSFEADLQEARLSKGGIRIRLQEQPFQILVLLLERPGLGTVSMLGVRAHHGQNLMVSGFGGYDHGVYRVG
jgi:hypothetical protein